MSFVYDGTVKRLTERIAALEALLGLGQGGTGMIEVDSLHDLTGRSAVTTEVFPFRSYGSGAHAALPSARAWRIIARPASDFSADAQAVIDGLVDAAPSGCLDGAYPVWVQLADTSGVLVDSPLLVDGDGWNAIPTGAGWHIQAVGGVGSSTDRFAYVVETVQDIDEAGQVNAPSHASPRELAIVQSNGLVAVDSGIIESAGARAGVIFWDRVVSGAASTSLRFYAVDDGGTDRVITLQTANTLNPQVYLIGRGVLIGQTGAQQAWPFDLPRRFRLRSVGAQGSESVLRLFLTP